MEQTCLLQAGITLISIKIENADKNRLKKDYVIYTIKNPFYQCFAAKAYQLNPRSKQFRYQFETWNLTFKKHKNYRP